MEERVFAPGLVALAGAVAAAIELSFLLLLVYAGSNKAIVKRAEERHRLEIPIAVKPILDELPLLKLGGKKKVRAKLPDMWKKNPPVQRFEAASAPSPMAEDNPEAIPSSPLVEADAAAPSPYAEVAKEVDQTLLDAGPDAESTEEGEGSPDGVKEGTERDPLKARAVSQYLAKIQGWFSSRFRSPELDCEVLKTLSASVSVSVGPERSVAAYSVVRPSGNPEFDARVRATMDSIVGQQLPPPPPLYPDILGQTLSPIFRGRCQ